MAIQTMQNDNGLKDITDLLTLVKDQKTTTTTGTNISQAGIQAQINDILGSNSGLSAVAGGQHAAGFYNSSVNTQLINDLLTRTAAQVAQRNATTTQTTNKKAALSSKDVLTTIGTLALKNPSKLKDLYKSVHDYFNAPNAVSDSPVAPDVVGNGELTADLSGNLNDAIASGTNLNVTATTADNSQVFEALNQAFNDAGYSSAGTDAAYSALGGSAESVNALPAGYTDAAVADTIPEAISVDSSGAGAGAVVDSAAGGVGGDAAAGFGEGLGATAGWAALAAYGAADLNQDVKAGNQDVLWSDAIGGMGTGDIVGAAEKGGSAKDIIANAAGPASGLVKNVADNTGWIICTELLRQGRMPKEYYVPGLRVFQSYRSDLLDGYYIWARPTVALLKSKPFCLRSRIVASIFNSRAEFLASLYGVKSARNTATGQLISASVYGFCWLLGQYLKHTRNAKEGEFA